VNRSSIVISVAYRVNDISNKNKNKLQEEENFETKNRYLGHLPR